MVNPNGFYTYAYLREDRTPYYIGKGCGRRICDNNGRPCKKPADVSRIIFLKQNLTEEEAFKHEIYMIAVFGRKDLGSGILHNKSDGGEGSRGYNHTDEAKKKITISKMGHSVSEKTKQKLREHNVKYLYEITSPEGEIYTTDNLNYFCKSNGLDTAAMQRVCSGKQKSHTPKRKDRVPNTIGWTVRKLEHLT
jgi:hypothetical protein